MKIIGKKNKQDKRHKNNKGKINIKQRLGQ